MPKDNANNIIPTKKRLCKSKKSIPPVILEVRRLISLNFKNQDEFYRATNLGKTTYYKILNMKGQSLDLSTIICIGIGCNLSKDELFQLIRLGRICIDHPDDEYQKDYKYIIEHVYDENEKNKLFVINDYLVSRGYDCMFDC